MPAHALVKAGASAIAHPHTVQGARVGGIAVQDPRRGRSQARRADSRPAATSQSASSQAELEKRAAIHESVLGYDNARHPQGLMMGAADKVGGIGDKAFNLEFMAPGAAYILRQPLGRFAGARHTIGAVLDAPVQALKNTSLAELWHNPAKLAAEYHKAAHQFSTGESFIGNKAKLEPGMLDKVKSWFGVKFTPREARTPYAGSATFEAGAKKYAALAEAGAHKVPAALTEAKGLTKWLNRAAHTKLLPLAIIGGLGVASIHALGRFGQKASGELTDIAEIVSDVTGEKITATQLLKPEKLSEVARELRGNLMAHLLPGAMGAVGEVATNYAFGKMSGAGEAVGHGIGSMMSGQLPLMIGMGLQNAQKGLAPAEHFPNAYLIIKDMQAKGQPVDPQYYAELIAAASGRARAAGGANAELVQEMAKNYAADGATAALVVKEIFAKEPFEKRAIVAAKAIDERHKAEVAEPATTAPLVAQAKADTPTMQVGAMEHQGKMQQALRQVGA